MESKVLVNKDLIYVVPKDNHNKEDLIDLLKKHSEIKFISFVGIDLWGNDTDEKIPVSHFLKDIDNMLENGIQTDGSSVNLSEISTLSDARVDLIPDKDAKWYIDYNYENIDIKSGLPVGTLRIISFLLHNGKFIDSRYVLKSSVDKFRKAMLKKLENKDLLTSYGLTSLDEIDTLELMLGTELEFWVRTPYDTINVEKLVLSQSLKEQYWKRTKGVVRTALEKTLQILDLYGINPEMGHKEVGGLATYIAGDNVDNHIVEQMEIDWKFDKVLQSADNELLARIIIKEVFRLHGLEVSFLAKPIKEVAGNGEHCHFSLMLKLKDGKSINLIAPTEEGTYLSKVGWGMIMGILKNYKVINPFVSYTNDALNRLEPGYEAPTHSVGTIGDRRNRTVLIALVKDSNNPLSTRFELRAPNPKTNIFLAASAVLAGILDGINYALKEDVTNKSLEMEFSKGFEQEGKYLEKGRIYREEKDIFEAYTEQQRDEYFGSSPRTVYENVINLINGNTDVLSLILDKEVVDVHANLALQNWLLDLNQRIIPHNRRSIRSCVKIESNDEYDQELWQQIIELKEDIAKDKKDKKCIASRIGELTNKKCFKEVSDLQIEMKDKMKKLKKLYEIYRNNQV